MRVRKTLLILVLIAFAVWGIKVVWLLQRNVSMPSQIKRQAETDRQVLMVQFRNRERKLNDDYGVKKYLATGQTVYDRIFNTQEQTVVDLIQKIASESIPKGWNCEVRVEEFTHFILLVYLPHNLARADAAEVASYLVPVVKHCDFSLSDVAVFDRVHKSYLFFDIDALKHIGREGKLTATLLEKVKQQGESFTQFNSMTIQCKKYEQHLVLPVEIAGPTGVETCIALFDTGASVTTISHSIILQTGSDNLAISPRRSFTTANGWMSCPIVYREVNVGGFPKRIEVAVNQRDEVNLLGMNYFQGLKYIVDSQSACIYVWEDPAIEIPEFKQTVPKDATKNLKDPVDDGQKKTDGEDKESPPEPVKLGGDVSSRDLNDLATFADKWLDVIHDANGASEK